MKLLIELEIFAYYTLVSIGLWCVEEGLIDFLIICTKTEIAQYFYLKVNGSVS